MLVKGKVKVQAHEKDAKELYPGQMFSYHISTFKENITQVDVNEYTAWKDGYYQFRKQKMNVIFRKISNFYGANIKWNKQLDELTCSGKLDLKDDLDEVLNTLKKAAPIVITKINATIYIDVEPLN